MECFGLRKNIAPSPHTMESFSHSLQVCQPSWQATDVELHLVEILHLTSHQSPPFPASTIIQLVRPNYRHPTFQNLLYLPQRPDTEHACPTQLPLVPTLVQNAVASARPPSAGAIYIHRHFDHTQNLKYHHHIRQSTERINLGMLAACSPIALLHHRRDLGRRVCATGRGGRH